jgi:hypothetical protein
MAASPRQARAVGAAWRRGPAARAAVQRVRGQPGLAFMSCMPPPAPPPQAAAPARTAAALLLLAVAALALARPAAGAPSAPPAAARAPPGAPAAPVAPRAARRPWPHPVALQGSAMLIGWYAGAVEVLLRRGVIAPRATSFSGLSGGAFTSVATTLGLNGTRQMGIWKDVSGGGGGRGGGWGPPAQGPVGCLLALAPG